MAYDRPTRWQIPVALALGLALLALPDVLAAFGQEFYLGLATRILIYALAATSLNLILGFGGMVSLGHAAFLGIGAYTTALAQQAGWTSAPAAFALSMTMAGAFAVVVGAVSLRTRGVYFIMITLAFAQMAYYLFVSARAWGGDDGLTLSTRLQLGPWSLGNEQALYFTSVLLLALVLAAQHRLLDARFGRTLQAIRENETRMAALGYPVFRVQLTAFVLGGMLAGLAGSLLVNQTGLASPGLLQWTQSGTLLVMVIIGGVGLRYGGLLGAALLLGLEEVLVGLTPHWHLLLGAFLLAIVFFAPQGIGGLLRRRHG